MVVGFRKWECFIVLILLSLTVMNCDDDDGVTCPPACDVIFMDDFNDDNDDGWSHNGSWSVIQGTYTCTPSTVDYNWAWVEGQNLTVEEFDIVARLRYRQSGSSDNVGIIAYRSDDRHYRFAYSMESDQLSLFQYEGEYEQHTVATLYLNLMVWHWFKLKIVRSQGALYFQGKAWPDGTPEPSEAQLEYTDNTPLRTGGIGLYFRQTKGPFNNMVEVDEITVITPRRSN
jgi:hypothetical protein